jgi:N6-adenosine-specific RNA methylase IME4
MAVLSRARTALAAAKTVTDFAQIADHAEAVRYAAKRAGIASEISRDAAEIKLLAERGAGTLLAKMEKHKGGRPNKTGNVVLPVSLDEIGIDKMRSSRWQQIASVPQAAFDAYLAGAVEPTSAGILKIAAKAKATAPRRSSISTPEAVRIGGLDEIDGQKFGCIYADPPWKYGNQSTRASTDNHYQTMTVEQVCEMPVGNLAAADAHLHLWTTNAFLFDAKQVIEAWGFEYRSCFVWVKPQMGIGNYWRVSHEFLLLGIRGNAKRFASRSLTSWGAFDRSKHSRKPDEIRQMVERASPGPYLEIFGREPVPGWTVFGNEIEPQRRFA